MFCVSGPLAVFRRDAIYNYLPAWAKDRFAGAEFRFATDRQLTGYVLGQCGAASASSGSTRTSLRPGYRLSGSRWRIEYVRSARA